MGHPCGDLEVYTWGRMCVGRGASTLGDVRGVGVHRVSVGLSTTCPWVVRRASDTRPWAVRPRLLRDRGLSTDIP